MYDVTIYRKFSNESFLDWEMEEAEYEAQSFYFRVERTIKLPFIPQLGMRLDLGETSVSVQSLTYFAERGDFLVESTLDIASKDGATKLVNKYIKAGWVLN